MSSARSTALSCPCVQCFFGDQSICASTGRPLLTNSRTRVAMLAIALSCMEGTAATREKCNMIRANRSATTCEFADNLASTSLIFAALQVNQRVQTMFRACAALRPRGSLVHHRSGHTGRQSGSANSSKFTQDLSIPIKPLPNNLPF